MLNTSKRPQNAGATWGKLQEAGSKTKSTEPEGVTEADRALKLDRLLSNSRSATVLQVEESSLRILLQSKNVKRFKLVGGKRGYDVFLETTSGLPGMLVTLRKPDKPRRRSSVDGFIRWLQRQGVEVPPICITFD